MAVGMAVGMVAVLALPSLAAAQGVTLTNTTTVQVNFEFVRGDGSLASDSIGAGVSNYFASSPSTVSRGFAVIRITTRLGDGTLVPVQANLRLDRAYEIYLDGQGVFQVREAAAAAPAPAPKSGAGPNTKVIASALVELEQHIKWAAVTDKWRGQRSGWVSQLKAATTPAEISLALLSLEAVMSHGAFEDSWAGRRDGWIDQVRAARTEQEIAQLLLALEQQTRWAAVEEAWRALRDGWVARLKAVR
jgi:hypothetical protein